MKVINIDEALNLEKAVFVDLRSPKEFENATIPGAVNIPVFNNEEREIIGKIYKKIDRGSAYEKGLEILSSKLLQIYKSIKEIQKNNKVIIFCWRGGMRSRSIAEVLDLMNLDNIYVLKGGYKAYRKYVIESLQNINLWFDFVVVHGMTGVGKTELLSILEKKGAEIIDLEKMANNRGSIFGSYGMGRPASQKMFESYLLQKLNQISKNVVFIESESARIGNIIVPKFLINKMEQGRHILLKAPLAIRVNRLKKIYSNDLNDDEVLRIKKSLSKITNKLGKQNYQNLIKYLETRNIDKFIEKLLIKYYDPSYKHSEMKVKKYDMVLDSSNLQTAAEQIIKKFINNDREVS